MKIVKGFKLRTVMGEAVIVAEGAKQVDFNKLISLNESAALMWRAAEGKDFTAEDMAQVLVDNYEGVDMDTAIADAGKIVDEWKRLGLVE